MSEVVLVVLQRPETAPDLLRAAERLTTMADGARVSALATGTAQPALKAAFDDWRAPPRPASVHAHWHASSEVPCAAIEERGGRADLIVVARPAEDDDRAARKAFRTALLKTGRPVLVVPPGRLAAPEFGRRVAIAWLATTSRPVCPVTATDMQVSSIIYRAQPTTNFPAVS